MFNSLNHIILPLGDGLCYRGAFSFLLDWLETQFILKGSSRRSEGSGLKKKPPLLTQWIALVFSERQGVRISYK